MLLSCYAVHYPNGIRYVMAFSPNDAHDLAMLRWGTPPTLVELA